MEYQEKYEKLFAEFEQYKKESIKWSLEDFISLEDDYEISVEKAQEALEAMINNHDANDGITWETIETYKSMYGTKKK